MPPERQLTDDLLAALNAHDVDRLGRLIAPAYHGADVSRRRECVGSEQARHELLAWLRAFPDLQVTALDVLVEAPRVLVRWTLHGTHRGAFLNVPPTGRRVAVEGFALLTVEDGRIAEARHLWDLAGMLRAMRLLPELPRSAAGSAPSMPA